MGLLRRSLDQPQSEPERQFQLEHERVMRPSSNSVSEILKTLFSGRKKKRKRP
jgi:hypothetical protein